MSAHNALHLRLTSTAVGLPPMLRAALRSLPTGWTPLTHQIRHYSPKADGYPLDFTFYPAFFSLPEQQLLLSTALEKLDMSEPRKVRRRQKEYITSRTARGPTANTVDDLFLPDEYYTFEEVRPKLSHADAAVCRHWIFNPHLRRVTSTVSSDDIAKCTSLHGRRTGLNCPVS